MDSSAALKGCSISFDFFCKLNNLWSLRLNKALGPVVELKQFLLSNAFRFEGLSFTPTFVADQDRKAFAAIGRYKVDFFSMCYAWPCSVLCSTSEACGDAAIPCTKSVVARLMSERSLHTQLVYDE